MDWCALHGHTHFSDGLVGPESVMDYAKSVGCSALAITDHGTLAGTYLAFRSPDVPVIAGVEIYHYGNDNQAAGVRRPVYHLTLLALNDTGFRSLCALQRQAWQQGVRGKAIYELFEAMEKGQRWPGVVCLTGCPSSYYAMLCRDAREADARAWLRALGSMFDEVYVEVQGGSEVQDCYALNAIRYGREESIRAVSTPDYHYRNSSEKDLHKALQAARHKPFSVDIDLSFRCPETYAEEEGIENGLALARRVSYTPLSRVQYGAEYNLLELARQQLERLGYGSSSEYRSRLEYEYNVIERCGFLWYFQVLYHVCSILRSAGIAYEARGSACASLFAWCLQITHLDPIANGLLFERFLSPERRELPDIDIDVPSRCRSRALNLISEHYNVSKIITINRLGKKSAAAAARRASSEGANVSESQLVGLVYNTGVHAAGIIIWPKDAECMTPLRWSKQHGLVSEWPADVNPYVKFDLLGQKTLDVVSCFTGHQGQDAVLETDAILEALADGSYGVFQAEGAMQGFWETSGLCTRDELRALIAIYRPAVLQTVAKEIVSCNEIDEEISRLCLIGYPVFQEDVMRILNCVVGLPMEQTYSVIKRLAKKDAAYIESFTRTLRERLLQSGWPPERIESVVSLLLAYAGYGFNLAHATAYAARLIQTAVYRKCHYAPYMSMLIDYETDPVRRASYLWVLHNRGYTIVPGLSTTTQVDASKKVVRVGLSCIRSIGEDGDYVSKCIVPGRPIVDVVADLRGHGRAYRALLESGILTWLTGLTPQALMSWWEHGCTCMLRKRKPKVEPHDLHFGVVLLEEQRELPSASLVPIYNRSAGVLLWNVGYGVASRWSYGVRHARVRGLCVYRQRLLYLIDWSGFISEIAANSGFSKAEMQSMSYTEMEMQARWAGKTVYGEPILSNA